MGFDVVAYETALAKGIRGNFIVGEDKALLTFGQVLAGALGVTEDKVVGALDASPAAYRFAVQLAGASWSTPATRASGLHDLGLALAGTSKQDDLVLTTTMAKLALKAALPAALRASKGKDVGKDTDIEAKAVAIEGSPATAQLATDAAASMGVVLVDVKQANPNDPAIRAVASSFAAANVAKFALQSADPTLTAILCAFTAEQSSLASGTDAALIACAAVAVSALGGAVAAKKAKEG